VRLGKPLHRYDLVESTQAIARGLAEHGAPEGTTVQAATQTAGRGRLGRHFFSPPGGLYLSVILRPPLAPAQAQLIGLAAGLAVAEAVKQVAGAQPMLKWPNDLLIGGRKVAGLLVELASEAQRVRFAILGIGVNVNIPRESFPEELRASATSLAVEVAGHVPLDRLRDAALRRLEERYRQLCALGPGPVVDGWRAWPNMLGQRVRTAAGDEGTAEDLDLDGALVLRLDSAERRRLLAGEVHLSRHETVDSR
jgi:BirA family biotin operon repressor/biotin-[acetyl-CoA-carboxylase] ligase